jgi:hypothetical protein
MKKFSILLMIVFSPLINANANIDSMVKKQCQYITKSSDNMIANTYLLGIVEGINYATPYSDATELAKSADTNNIVLIACKNAFENKTIHGFDADYKWQVMKLTSKKHSQMEQQF